MHATGKGLKFESRLTSLNPFCILNGEDKNRSGPFESRRRFTGFRFE